MNKKKSAAFCAALVLLLTLCACGGDKAGDEFYGIGSVAWGENGSALLENSGFLEVIDYNAEFAGHAAQLHYIFGEDGGLSSAYYLFTQPEDTGITELYTGILGDLKELYGEPGLSVTTDENGDSVPSPTIEDVIGGEAETCSDVWKSIPGPEGLSVSAVLQLNPNDQVALIFYAR